MRPRRLFGSVNLLGFVLLLGAGFPRAGYAEHLVLKGGYCLRDVYVEANVRGFIIFTQPGKEAIWKISENYILKSVEKIPPDVSTLPMEQLSEYVERMEASLPGAATPADPGVQAPGASTAASPGAQGGFAPPEVSREWDSEVDGNVRERIGDRGGRALASVGGRDSIFLRNHTGLKDAVCVFGNLGASRYAMDSVNRLIDSNNVVLNAHQRAPQPGLHQGTHKNIGLDVWLSERVALGLEGEWLSAEAAGGDALWGVAYAFPAFAWGSFVRVGFSPEQNWLCSLALGMYHLELQEASATYKDVYDGVPRSLRFPIRGSTEACKVDVRLEYIFSNGVSLGLGGGYRWAQVSNQTVSAEGRVFQWLEPNGERVILDYSGAFMQTGLRYYFR